MNKQNKLHVLATAALICLLPACDWDKGCCHGSKHCQTETPVNTTTTNVPEEQNEANEAVEVQAVQPDTKETMKRTTLPSGLAYEILTEAPADAKKPTKGQTVIVHYTGWLADENGNADLTKKFDSSVDRGTPFSFAIGTNRVIKGWDEGVIDMKVGEKRRLIIPSELGYGARGAGAVIPGGATLVFDVELLDVK